MHWIKKIFGKTEKNNTPMLQEYKIGDKVILADQQTIDYYESKLPKPIR